MHVRQLRYVNQRYLTKIGELKQMIENRRG